ncbi:HAD-IIB family hydrolase [Candidatus Woesearchaeota archaeon]|nr:HAD-IIB family hydrolase [Candidatus Woesearchaeota archaeon]
MTIDKIIIFSDMDGTFLDHSTYSYSKAMPAIRKIVKNKIPFVFCSSRVSHEMDIYYKKIKIRHPFISENGAAIFIPKGYFKFNFKHDYIKKGNKIIQFGTKYEKLRKVLVKIRKETGYNMKGFGDLTLKELSENAGISLKKARLAKKREFTEPFIILDGDINKIKKLIKKHGLNYTKGGRYHYIMGKNDKGKAVNTLKKLFKKEFGKITTIGLGDGQNDLPMLKNVDYGYQVKTYKGEYSYRNKAVIRINKIGPKGFNEAVLRHL